MSLFGQTLEDMEFIFIDDCSPDGSMEIIRNVLETEFPSRKPQVKFYRMPQNSGQAKVRMKGIELSTGEYVIHCDSDDEAEPDAYRSLYAKAIEGDYDIVTCDFWIGNEGGWRRKSSGSEPGKAVSDIMCGRVMGSLWSRLIRRTLLQDLVPPAANMAEDAVLVLQATLRAKRIAHLPEPLYRYYVRTDSISGRQGLEPALERWSYMYANAKVAVGVLEDKYGFAPDNPDVVMYKYSTRAYLLPFINKAGVYEKWRNTFPEVDSVLLKTKGVPSDTKFWFVLIHLRLYHPWKVLTGKARC